MENRSLWEGFAGSDPGCYQTSKCEIRMKGKQLITLPNKGNIIFRVLYVFLSSTLICLHRFCSSRLAMYICAFFPSLVCRCCLAMNETLPKIKQHWREALKTVHSFLKRTATLWSLCFPFHPAQNGQHIGQHSALFSFQSLLHFCNRHPKVRHTL